MKTISNSMSKEARRAVVLIRAEMKKAKPDGTVIFNLLCGKGGKKYHLTDTVYYN